MNQDDREHEEIQRLLAERGPVQAPDDLAGDVMRQVRAEPRHRRRRLGWPASVQMRPALALCAAAAVLLATGFGISRLSSTTSSAPGDAAAEVHGAQTKGATRSPAATPSAANALVTVAGVPRHQARRVLGSLWPVAPSDTAMQVGSAITVRVPSARFDAITRQLRSRAAANTSGPGVTIILRRR